MYNIYMYNIYMIDRGCGGGKKERARFATHYH